MKKLIVTAILGIFTFGIITAQTEEPQEQIFPFHFGIVPRSIDGQFTNKASFNLFVGLSKNEKAFTFSSLASIIRNNASGLQLAGLYNQIGNDANGLQFAGLLNIIGNNASGLQLGGLANLTTNDFKGLQFAGLLNKSRTMTGLQLAGISNYTTGDAKGFQFGGIVNIASNDFTGLQLAGIANITTNNVKGMQFAGLINAAENVKGLQFAALVNRAKNVKGVQFAALVNIAEHSDYPIGLINIIKEGEKSLGVTYDDTGSTILAFRSGGRILYGILGTGYNYKAHDEKFVMEGGFGAHIPIIERFRINLEAKTQHMTSFKSTYVSKNTFSILPAFKILQNLEIFAGPTLNHMITDNLENTNLFLSNNLWKSFGDSKLKQLYIGYTAGVQYIF